MKLLQLFNDLSIASATISYVIDHIIRRQEDLDLRPLGKTWFAQELRKKIEHGQIYLADMQVAYPWKCTGACRQYLDRTKFPGPMGSSYCKTCSVPVRSPDYKVCYLLTSTRVLDDASWEDLTTAEHLGTSCHDESGFVEESSFAEKTSFLGFRDRHLEKFKQIDPNDRFGHLLSKLVAEDRITFDGSRCKLVIGYDDGYLIAR